MRGLSKMMADLGMPPISVGSQKILPSPTKQLARLVGFGDRIKVGDVVEVAEQESGFDRTVTKRYTDEAKTAVAVKKAARKQLSAILASLKG